MIRTTRIHADGSIVQQADVTSLGQKPAPEEFLWIDCESIPEKDEKQLLAAFGCHPLAIKDAQRTRHPPKIEHFDDMLFILYRGLVEVKEGLVVEPLQIALFVGDNFIITRHSKPSISIDQWWNNQQLVSLLKTPFLLASKLIHTSFGIYLDTILAFEQELSEKEELMQDLGDDNDLRELISYRGRLRKLKRTFNYHERLTSALVAMTQDDERFSVFAHEAQDLHERSDRILSLLGMYYEISGDLIEGYLSISSHRLNRTMQILTVVTTIFVPLGFLAGLYGMNFQYIPELQIKYGYFILLGVMATISVTALIIFKIKRWL
ncbi:magnesium/cobalt transporter CorA [Aurantivibrio plasticivorans]